MCAQTHRRAYVQPHTHTHPYVYTPCTHAYARIRAREGIYLTPNLLYNISTTLPNRVQSSIRQHSLLLSNRCTIHINIGATLVALSVQTIIICHPLSSIRNHYPTNHRLLIIHSIICIANSHTLSPLSIISNTILSLSNNQSNSPSYQYVSML